jgi:hypothetical protein
MFGKRLRSFLLIVLEQLAKRFVADDVIKLEAPQLVQPPKRIYRLRIISRLCPIFGELC